MADGPPIDDPDGAPAGTDRPRPSLPPTEQPRNREEATQVDEEAARPAPPGRLSRIRANWLAGSRWSRLGSSILVAITVVTALFGAYVGYRSLPHGPSPEDWTRKVNAACERNAAELRDPFAALAQFLQGISSLLTQRADVAGAAADFTTVAKGLQDSADAYRSLIGSVRDLEAPKDAEHIDRFLTVGARLYRALDSVAADISRVSATVLKMPTGGVQDAAFKEGLDHVLNTTYHDIDGVGRETYPDYQRALITLKLSECAGWNASGRPSPIPPESAPVDVKPHSGELDAAQKALARRVGFDPRQCKLLPSPSAAVGVMSQVTCTAPGLAYTPVFLSFDTEAHMRAWFQVGATKRGDCGSGANVEYDLPSDAPQPGRIKCFAAPAGGYGSTVILTRSLIAFREDDTGPSRLHAWVMKAMDKVDRP